MSTVLEIRSENCTQKLSPQQKKFNRLLKNIQQQQQLLDEWKNTHIAIQQQAAQELFPIHAQWHQVLFQQVEALWTHKHNFKFPKTHLAKLEHIICSLIPLLLVTDTLNLQQIQTLQEIGTQYPSKIHGDLDDELFSTEQFSEEQRIEFEKRFLLEQLCIEFELSFEEIMQLDLEFNPNNPQPFFEAVAKYVQQREEQEFLNSLPTQLRANFEKDLESDRKKELKKQEKIERAQALATQSLKQIYLRISAVIHPDREQDEQEKIKKTELLQQVNQAYEQKNLLVLLQLQIQLEQSDQNKINSLAKEQLELYNINLEQQLQQLEQQVENIVYSFDWEQHEYRLYGKLKPKKLQKKYNIDLAHVKKNLESAQRDLENFLDLEVCRLVLRNRYIPLNTPYSPIYFD